MAGGNAGDNRSKGTRSGETHCATRYIVKGAYPSSAIFRNAGNRSLYKETAWRNSEPAPSELARRAEANLSAVWGRSQGSLARALIVRRDIRPDASRFGGPTSCAAA